MKMKFKSNQAFAARWQFRVVVILLAALVLLAQGFSYTLYRVGFFMILIFVPLQMGLGNTNSEFGAIKTIRKVLIVLVIVAVIFGISIEIAPFLVNLGRNKV